MKANTVIKFLTLSLALFSFTACGGTPETLTRDATADDFTLTLDPLTEKTTYKHTYKIVPNIDINGLKISFKYFDSGDNLIYNQERYLGDVKKDRDYFASISFSIVDFPKIADFKYTVLAGTVTYIAK